MEGNVCDSHHLDEDVRPPLRKRILAGYKKQNGSEQSASPPTPTTPTEVDARAKNLLSSSDGSGSGSSSLEEIAESSKIAALAAAEVAEAARAAAEEKAAVAAKAIAAAKSALNLVASFYEETSGRDRHTRRNKSKKQVTVNSLYKKRDEVENGKTGKTEHKLNRVIHTNSVIYKNSPPYSDSKSRKHKKPKISPVICKPEFPNGKATFDNEGSSHEVADAIENEERSQCLTKLFSSNWRVEKDLVTQKRKVRKQLVRIVERQVVYDQGMQTTNFLQATDIAVAIVPSSSNEMSVGTNQESPPRCEKESKVVQS